ncbi:MAG: polyprenyl synthetase family protein [Chloroflexi bacterium]|nr:polyprenyl synthetase family protein [Chloroflexota bacterium]MBI5350306.1 polyprenyl synthetase family protein [Chloroflexota bacterium]
MPLLSQLSSALDTELRAALDFKLPPPDDYARMLYYHLGWIDEGQPILVAGKRTRPTLTLLCAAASGGDWRNALPFAACVELIHNFSLVHDDIQDDSPLRRGRSTVWKLWGAPQAINAGDALFNYAHLALNRARQRNLESSIVLDAFQLIHDACYQLTLGQHYDMSFEKRGEVTVEEYLKMIEGKTASLIATSTELGALAANALSSVRACYREFGRHLGLAFQIRDDILGIWGDATLTGKSAATDIISRKKSLPVLYGLQRSEKLCSLYRPEANGGGSVTDIVAELEKCGARAYAEEKEKHHADLAISCLDSAKPKGEAGEHLHEITRQLLGRTN